MNTHQQQIITALDELGAQIRRMEQRMPAVRYELGELWAKDKAARNAVSTMATELEAIGAGGVESLRKFGGLVQIQEPQPAAPLVGQQEVQPGKPLRDLALGATSFLDHAGFDTSHLPAGMGAALRRLRDAAIAPAHPAEGVPAQCPNINEPRGCWRVACQLGGKCREPERSATQPAKQGEQANG